MRLLVNELLSHWESLEKGAYACTNSNHSEPVTSVRLIWYS
jgi:hypothetical protein